MKPLDYQRARDLQRLMTVEDLLREVESAHMPNELRVRFVAARRDIIGAARDYWSLVKIDEDETEVTGNAAESQP